MGFLHARFPKAAVCPHLWHIGCGVLTRFWQPLGTHEDGDAKTLGTENSVSVGVVLLLLLLLRHLVGITVWLLHCAA